MSRRYLYLGLFILTAAILGFVNPRSPPPNRSEPESGARLVAADDKARLVSVDNTGANRWVRPQIPREIEQQSEAIQEHQQQAFTLGTETSLSAWEREQRRLIEVSSPEEVDLKRRQAESGDAESAFWMYQLFNWCREMPRTGWQLDLGLRGVQSMLDGKDQRNPGGNTRFASQQLDDLEYAFGLCSGHGPDFDFTPAALRWLELSADLGHMGAQRLYHARARQLLTNINSSLVFQNPELIYEFKDRADVYAKAILATDHPLGLVLMARMLLVGDVYKRDLVMAYAYAHAAVTVSTGGVLNDAKAMRFWVEENIPPEKIADAEKLAREILDEES